MAVCSKSECGARLNPLAAVYLMLDDDKLHPFCRDCAAEAVKMRNRPDDVRYKV